MRPRSTGFSDVRDRRDFPLKTCERQDGWLRRSAASVKRWLIIIFGNASQHRTSQIIYGRQTLTPSSRTTSAFNVKAPGKSSKSRPPEERSTGNCICHSANCARWRTATYRIELFEFTTRPMTVRRRVFPAISGNGDARYWDAFHTLAAGSYTQRCDGQARKDHVRRRNRTLRDCRG